MPKKPNRYGMQEYIPEGHGDESGEYADESGSNVHFTNFKKPNGDESVTTTDTPKEIEQPQPEFEDKLIVDENHGDNDLYMKRLDEDIADEEDYKAFCEYIFNYIGEDIESFINEGKKKRFSSFNKPNKEEE